MKRTEFGALCSQRTLITQQQVCRTHLGTELVRVHVLNFKLRQLMRHKHEFHVRTPTLTEVRLDGTVRASAEDTDPIS